MRKLRTYKGVAFDPAKAVFLYEGCRFGHAVDVIFHARYPACISSFRTDDDHAELMRLKAEPYEPMPRLEDVVRNWTAKQIEKGVSLIPLSSLNYIELVRDIRTAFPHIDQEER